MDAEVPSLIGVRFRAIEQCQKTGTARLDGQQPSSELKTGEGRTEHRANVTALFLL
jgi:hypothetical protein